jgi:alkylation response protein AidB-like acyl-CoA dehydrogenase
MSVVSATSAQAHAPVSLSLAARARRIAAVLSAQAAAGEAQGSLTDATLAALQSEGFLKFWVPKCFGGEETPPVEALEAIEALCHADASTGWVVMATQVCAATAAAYLAPKAAQAIFGSQAPIIAGQGQPNGKAVAEPGGYRLSGSWSYGSGTRHADYLHTGGLIHAGGKPWIRPGASAPDVRIFIVPIREAKLLGNWDTLGLRATGSVDYTIDSAHVPEEYTHDLVAKTPNQGGDLYRIGVPGFSAMGHSGFAFGVARRALDELSAIGNGERRPAYMSGAQSETFQESFASAEAKLRSVRALGFEVWSDVQRTIERGDPMDVRQGTLIRLVVNHSTSVASEIASFAFRFAGGQGTRQGALQRCFRDMQTGAQHATASPNILGECGRELLGLEKGKVWGFRNLIVP